MPLVPRVNLGDGEDLDSDWSPSWLTWSGCGESVSSKPKELTSLEDEGYRELHRRQRVPPGLTPGVYTVLTRLSHSSLIFLVCARLLHHC